MNDDSHLQPDDDGKLEQILSHLKHLEPPLEARIVLRRVVAAELSRAGSASRQGNRAWWRRSISIPVPVAASILLVTVFAIVFTVRGGPAPGPPGLAAPHLSEESVGATGDRVAVAARMPQMRATTKYYAAETYLCGIGRVNSESRYITQEQNHDR